MDIVGTRGAVKKDMERGLHVYTQDKHIHTHIYVHTLICRVGSSLSGFLSSAGVVSSYKRNIATGLFYVLSMKLEVRS